MADWNKLSNSSSKQKKPAYIRKGFTGTRRQLESFSCGRNGKPNYKAILWDTLFWDCGWSARAIARAFGVTSNAVRVQVTREAWEKSTAQSKKWIEDNREAHNDLQRTRLQKNPDIRFDIHMDSLVRQRPEYAEDMANWTLEEEKAVREIYYECYRLNDRDGAHSWHVDHIVPYAVGGRHVPSNLRILRREENQRRPKDGSDVLRKWGEYLGQGW